MPQNDGSGRFQARIHEDFEMGRTRLLLAQRRADGYVDLLMGDGTWQTIEDGSVSSSPPGIVLPHQAIGAIAEAVAKYLGNQLPSQAEVAVLREWLAVEQRRVDTFLAPSPKTASGSDDG